MFELIYNYLVQFLSCYQLFPLFLSIVIWLLLVVVIYACISGVFSAVEWFIVGLVNGFSNASDKQNFTK